MQRHEGIQQQWGWSQGVRGMEGWSWEAGSTHYVRLKVWALISRQRGAMERFWVGQWFIQICMLEAVLRVCVDNRIRVEEMQWGDPRCLNYLPSSWHKGSEERCEILRGNQCSLEIKWMWKARKRRSARTIVCKFETMGKWSRLRNGSCFGYVKFELSVGHPVQDV